MYLKSLLSGRRSWLNGGDEDADFVATGEPDADAAVLLEADEARVRSVGKINDRHVESIVKIS